MEPEFARGCERFLERLQDALDERGAPGALARDPHASGCASCREAVAAFTALEQALTREPGAEPPPGFAASVVRLIEAESARSRRRARVSALVAVAAAVALGAGLDLGLTLRGGALRAGFLGLYADGHALVQAAGARAGSLGLEDVRGLEDLRGLSLPALPSLPGSLATLALVGAAGLVAGELAWWRRVRRAGGAA